MRQFSIVIDYDPENEWEATAWLSADQEHQLHWASTDVHTLLAAIGRDLAEEVKASTPTS